MQAFTDSEAEGLQAAGWAAAPASHRNPHGCANAPTAWPKRS